MAHSFQTCLFLFLVATEVEDNEKIQKIIDIFFVILQAQIFVLFDEESKKSSIIALSRNGYKKIKICCQLIKLIINLLSCQYVKNMLTIDPPDNNY